MELLNRAIFALLISTLLLISCKNEKIEQAEETNNLVINLSVGDIVKLGRFDQDNDNKNGKEKIEWTVIDTTKDKALLITKYAIDCRRYNERDLEITWENCTLRNWLNADFYNDVFSDEEKKIIEVTHNVNSDNIDYGTNGGNDTFDSVFLLSYDEALKYFDKDAERRCLQTNYSKSNGGFETEAGKETNWWLRSPGNTSHYAMIVKPSGGLGTYMQANDSKTVVRPAIWIKTR